MDDMNFEALPPQQLYDMAVQVLDSSDASKLPDATLQMLRNAKVRALRNGAVASPNDKSEETAKTLILSERVNNAVREAVEEGWASVKKFIKVIGYNFTFTESAFSNETSVLTAPTYHSPSFKKPLLVESYKWARAPPFVADLAYASSKWPGAKCAYRIVIFMSVLLSTRCRTRILPPFIIK